MEPYQERLFEEAKNIETNLIKLEAFMNTPEKWGTVDPTQQMLMELQRDSMRLYLQILSYRIQRIPAAVDDDDLNEPLGERTASCDGEVCESCQ